MWGSLPVLTRHSHACEFWVSVKACLVVRDVASHLSFFWRKGLLASDICPLFLLRDKWRRGLCLSPSDTLAKFSCLEAYTSQELYVSGRNRRKRVSISRPVEPLSGAESEGLVLSGGFSHSHWVRPEKQTFPQGRFLGCQRSLLKTHFPGMGCQEYPQKGRSGVNDLPSA